MKIQVQMEIIKIKNRGFLVRIKTTSIHQPPRNRIRINTKIYNTYYADN
jgi:hypothetical protein